MMTTIQLTFTFMHPFKQNVESIPYKGYEFTNWVEDLGNHSSIPVNTPLLGNKSIANFSNSFGLASDGANGIFNINKYGIFAANFKEIPPMVSPELWGPIYGIVVSSIVGMSIPGIVGFVKSNRSIKKFNHYHKKIMSIYDDGKLDYNDIGTLDKIKNGIADSYAKGNINKEQYESLNKELSTLYEEVFAKKIVSLEPVDKNIKVKLKELENAISNSYSKGKLNELHYGLLKDKISEFYGRKD